MSNKLFPTKSDNVGKVVSNTSKCVILAGGKGTRLAEETRFLPKPMLEIGGKPVLWHIMKIFYTYGVKEFIICLGYKGFCIKEYFSNYFLHQSDIRFDFKNGTHEVLRDVSEDWQVTLIDTGSETMTGGRLKRVAEYIGDEDFYFTYGDGVGDIDISKLTELHKQEGRLATVTATSPPSRFGDMICDENKVISFKEKSRDQAIWINGGFFLMSPKVIDLISDDDTIWEDIPMRKLVSMEQLSVYRHSGFWQPMDTLAEKNLLNHLWDTNEAPWNLWS